ncbi:MAG: hypothetical protein HZA54_13645, partial [Planctomycetes bacterium]|nr:hypothetical protein [Planctomycetota bacterium]
RLMGDPPPTPPPAAGAATAAAGPTAADRALACLAAGMDPAPGSFGVYTEAYAPGNHFVVPGPFGVPGRAVPVRVDLLATDPEQGYATVIRNEFLVGDATLGDWGGCYLLNGRSGKDGPLPNWGEAGQAGWDLTGADHLVFRARGLRGGERVNFFVGGVGRDPRTGLPREGVPYPETFRARALVNIELGTEWKEYRIDVADADLRYVVSGLGWATDAARNPQGCVFLLDDIRYAGKGGIFDDQARAPRLLASYATRPPASAPTPGGSLPFDATWRNCALVADNALAALAFLARGSADDRRRARRIADAFLFAMTHDPEYADGRLRNAYQAGDLASPPGWGANGRAQTVRLPGWWDPTAKDGKGMWDADSWWLGTDSASLGWSILALLACADSAEDGERYVAAAATLGSWIERNCSSPAAGFTAGVLGWSPEKPDVRPCPQTWRSTEGNLVLAVAFDRLAAATRNAAWEAHSARALAYVASMRDPVAELYYAGDDGRGNTTFTPLPLGLQALILLWWCDQPGNHAKMLPMLAEVRRRYALRCATCALGGFDADEDRDGVFVEGAARMALACRRLGAREEGEALTRALGVLQERSGALGGGLPAACHEGVTTGFATRLPARTHLGATAWFVLAALDADPFAAPARRE